MSVFSGAAESGGGGGSSAAGAGAGLIGGIIGAGTSFLGQANSEQFARKLAQRGIRWRAHDMRQAGINPILAARPGGVGGASIGPAGGGNIGSAVTSGIAAGAQSKGVNAQVKTQKTVRDVNAQTVKESQAREAMHRAQGTLADAQAVKAVSEANANEYDNVRRQQDANFYDTPEGREFRQMERRIESVKELLPSWWIGTGGRRGNRIRKGN